ncbi:MAG: DUF4160 domain-containing protein [Acidobacteriaceae bacterium]|jgi:hypothetical protein|nr:DUF4160 domain-containing protein [Acidobacteriaceae bacterium]
MPTIQRFTNCRIAIYADDHSPPHFHIEGRGFRAVIDINSMAVRAGNTRKAAEAMAWAAAHKHLLRTEWTRLNRRT